MYRTNDPRFRRRLNDITHTLETANESAQSNIYIFGQHYVKPCFESIGSCFTTCFDASCPSLNISQRDRLRRRGRARSRGRAELSFDFYDDWDEDENDGLLSWGNDEFDRLVASTGSVLAQGYGTVNAQPGRQRGMSYPKTRKKSVVEAEDPTVIPGSSGFWRRLFGARDLRYKPSAADLQEHPGARKRGIRQNLTEGEALLEEDEHAEGRRRGGRARSGTQGSGHTTDSYSSRGDIFPSDEEDDAIPLDDEFAMVLERRTTTDGTATESSSARTPDRVKRGKRPSAGSRMSTRTISSRSTRSLLDSGKKRRSRTSSYGRTSISEDLPGMLEDVAPSAEEAPLLADLKRQESQLAQEEEEGVLRRRQSAQRLATERGLHDEDLPSKEATPRSTSPVNDPGQQPAPFNTDSEVDMEDYRPQ